MAEGVASARRGVELGLVLLAGAIAGTAYVLASLGRRSSLPATLVPFLAAVLGLLLVAHVAVRRTASGADPMLLPTAAFLHGIGWVMIARISDRWAGLQATWTLVGVVAFVATLVAVSRTSDLRRHQWTSLVAGLGLLMLPLVPGVGFTSGGARIWVSVGPVNFQPGEFAKILLALFFAAYLDERRNLITRASRTVLGLPVPEPRHFAPILVAWGMSVVIMVGQRDLGSSLLFFTLFIVMIWVATERSGWLVAGGAMFSLAAVAAYNLFSHVRTRVQIWVDPWDDYTGAGYQPVRGIFALANGSLTGTGLGLGDPGAIPAAHNDFIFAAVGEDLGLLGSTAVLAAFLLMTGAGMRTALRAQRDYDKLLATGLTTILAVQTFIIVGGVLRVVPLTGVTLPFMSYGGSSLVANYVLLALLVRISDGTARALHEVEDLPGPRERWAARGARRRAASA